MMTVNDNGFVWTEVGRQAYTRLDGSETTLRVWEAHCVVCGADIQCRTPLDASKSNAFGLRRCKEHKR